MSALNEINDRVRRSICPTWSFDGGERMEGRISEEDWNRVMLVLNFYADHHHWMSQSETGPHKLLVANGDVPGVDGWAMAEGVQQ